MRVVDAVSGLEQLLAVMHLEPRVPRATRGPVAAAPAAPAPASKHGLPGLVYLEIKCIEVEVRTLLKVYY